MVTFHETSQWMYACVSAFFFFLQTVKMRRVTPGRGDRWNLNAQCKEKLTKGGLELQMADKALHKAKDIHLS